MAQGIKWCLDRAAALILLLLLSPALVLIGLLVLVTEGSPVLHREQRLGRDGRVITLYKFRSMRDDGGPRLAPAGDPRITTTGRWLRQSRLDELPGLVGVLSGDMSLVGPRPLPPEHAAALAPAARAQLLSVRPGITGVSALAFLADDEVLGDVADAERLYRERVLPAKVALELDYLRRWSLWQDFRLLVNTATATWSPAARRQSRERVRALLSEGG